MTRRIGQTPNRGATSPARPAFTLIELLVVIAVIALLMAILLPVLGRVRKQARALRCQANLRQWGQILAVYAHDNEGRFPTDIAGSSGIWLLRGAIITGEDPNAPEDSFHHFRTQGIGCCPLATEPSTRGMFGTGTFFGSTGIMVEGTPGSTFSAWEITKPEPPFRGSYGYNSWLFQGFSPHFDRFASRAFDLEVLTLKGRADIPILLDAAYLWGKPRDAESPARREDAPGYGIRTFCINRHDGHVNSLFLDWSVRRIGLKELWTLYWYQEFDRAGRWTRAGGVRPEDWPEWMRGFKDY